jgi:hypothetical protein
MVAKVIVPPVQAAHSVRFSLGIVFAPCRGMVKLLILGLSLPALVVLAYCVLLKSRLRPHADRLAERLLWFAGVAFIAALFLLFVKLPGTSHIADAMSGFLAWFHS